MWIEINSSCFLLRFMIEFSKIRDGVRGFLGYKGKIVIRI